MDSPIYVDRGDGVALALHYRTGKGPTLVFFPGYMSDMEGSKAQALDLWAASQGLACLRFDYAGCGASQGDFRAGSISGWTADALHCIERQTQGPLILIGSSMGGWISLRAAEILADRVAGWVGIAPAPDFTLWGVEASLSAQERADLQAQGFFHRASGYGDPYIYTRRLIEDGAACAMLQRAIALDAPARILQGQQDEAVPWQLSLTLAEKIRSDNVQIYLIKDGDHRLSRDQDIAMLCATVGALVENISCV